MNAINRNNENMPFRGEELYAVAHEVHGDLYEDILDSIDRMLCTDTSPITVRTFQFQDTGSYMGLTNERFLDTEQDATLVYVTQALTIHKDTHKPPSSYAEEYHLRVATLVATATHPIVTDYYIEKLANGRYFGSMQRHCLGTLQLANDLENPLPYNKAEDMTVYDLFELDEVLAAHLKSVQQESEYAQFVKSIE